MFRGEFEEAIEVCFRAKRIGELGDRIQPVANRLIPLRTPAFCREAGPLHKTFHRADHVAVSVPNRNGP